jgi:hypothetical protein
VKMGGQQKQRCQTLKGKSLAWKHFETLISGFRRDVDVICGLLGNYTTSCGNYLVDNYHTMSCNYLINYLVNNYLTTPCNYPEDHRLHFEIFLAT